MAAFDLDLPDDWLDAVTLTLEATHLASTAIVGVDLDTGRIVGGTPAAETVLGTTLPAHIDDLVQAGVLVAADVDRVVRLAGDWPDLPEPVVRDTARSWNSDLLVRRDGRDVHVPIIVLQHRRFRGGRHLMLVVLGEEPEAPARPRSVGAAAEMWTVFDRDARVLAIDPRWTCLWADPEALVGTLVSPLVHPEDLPEVMPEAVEVHAGRSEFANYTVRLAADDGAWVAVDVELRLLHAPDVVVISRNRIVDGARRTIPPGLLTVRETSVVAALFEGRRVAQIAERDGVSVNTVRNQLKSIYRKLGVTGQADLLSRLHPPPARVASTRNSGDSTSGRPSP